MHPVLLHFIGHIIKYNVNIISRHISHCPDIYFNVGGSFQTGRVIYGLPYLYEEIDAAHRIVITSKDETQSAIDEIRAIASSAAR